MQIVAWGHRSYLDSKAQSSTEKLGLLYILIFLIYIYIFKKNVMKRRKKLFNGYS